MRTVVSAIASSIIYMGLTHASGASGMTYETVFAGFPSNTSQHGLRELSPQFFVRERMNREAGCLAAALYFEARGESRLGQIAVAQVISNRVRSRVYPDSICGVVWQNSHMQNRCQFSFTCDGRADVVRNRRVWIRTKRVAEAFLATRKTGSVPHAIPPVECLDKKTKRSTHYHATYVSPSWSKKLKLMRKIGGHVFYASRRVERTMPTGI